LRIIQIIAQWLFILCLPILLLTASVSLAVNCPWLYRYGFDKYNVSETTGLEKAELDKIPGGLISYFNSSEESISLSVLKDGEPFELFNAREVGHLRDVKDLFRLVYALLLGTGIYACVYAGINLFWWRKSRFYWGLVGGSGLTLVLMLAIGLAAAINFDWLFLNFHLISFANDLWMLNPATDYLIMLFPQGFWFDAAIYCAAAAAFLALVLGGLGWWRLRKERKQAV
jgi:integral membrane protein (TIGR01906 family)